MIKSYAGMRRDEVNTEALKQGQTMFGRDAQATRRRGVFYDWIVRERRG